MLCMHTMHECCCVCPCTCNIMPLHMMTEQLCKMQLMLLTPCDMVGDAHVQDSMHNSTHAYIHARTHASTDASTHVCTHVDSEGVVKRVEWRCGVWR